jgi:hypothetical protein
MEPWTPTQDEIDAIVQRAATQLVERIVRVDWIPLTMNSGWFAAIRHQ